MSGVPLFSFVSYVFYFFMKQLYGHRMQSLKVKDEKVKHRSSLFKVRWRNGCKNKFGLQCPGAGVVGTSQMGQDRALPGVQFLAGLPVPKLSNSINLSAKIATLLLFRLFLLCQIQ